MRKIPYSTVIASNKKTVFLEVVPMSLKFLNRQSYKYPRKCLFHSCYKRTVNSNVAKCVTKTG